MKSRVGNTSKSRLPIYLVYGLTLHKTDNRHWTKPDKQKVEAAAQLCYYGFALYLQPVFWRDHERMPIYEYVCEKCGSRIEVIQKISDEPPKRCQECRGRLEKVFSRTSFQLKGSGWYMTDYSSSGQKKDSPKEDKEPQKKADTPSSDATCGAGACKACE